MGICEFKSKNTTSSVVASVVKSINCSLMIFFQVAQKASPFSDQESYLQWELWSEDHTLTWWESKTEKRSLPLWKKILYKSSKYGWYFHRLVCGNILYVNTLYSSVGQSDTDISGRPSSYCPPLFIKQVSWAGQVLPFVLSGSTATPCPGRGCMLSGIAVFSGDNLFFMVED